MILVLSEFLNEIFNGNKIYNYPVCKQYLYLFDWTVYNPSLQILLLHKIRRF